MDQDLRHDPWLSRQDRHGIQQSRDAILYTALQDWVASQPNDHWHLSVQRDFFHEAATQITSLRMDNDAQAARLASLDAQRQIDSEARGTLWEVWEAIYTPDEMRLMQPVYSDRFLSPEAEARAQRLGEAIDRMSD